MSISGNDNKCDFCYGVDGQAQGATGSDGHVAPRKQRRMSS